MLSSQQHYRTKPVKLLQINMKFSLQGPSSKVTEVQWICSKQHDASGGAVVRQAPQDHRIPLPTNSTITDYQRRCIGVVNVSACLMHASVMRKQSKRLEITMPGMRVS